MDKKLLIGSFIAALMLVSLLAPMLIVTPAAAADPAEWYMTVEGVLDSDYYSLYPFELNRLTFGFSKFGELIDSNTKIGLLYANKLDAFANEPYVPEYEWQEGWVINITYAYNGFYRNVWAFALYSDVWSAASIGGDWKRASSPTSTDVVGGRKYGGWSADGTIIGYVETAPLQVLYNSPRRFIALASTTIYEDTSKQFPLVKLDFTFVFDKVKKYVIVIKDIKRLDRRKFSSAFQIEFSERGEWDLGLTVAPKSYVHFYNNLSTCYHEGWHPYYPNNAYYDVCQIISSDTPGYVGFVAFWPSLISKYVEATQYATRKTRLTTLETYVAKFKGDGSKTKFEIKAPNPAPIAYPRGDGVWKEDPMVFVNGMLQAPAGAAAGWRIDYPYTYDPDTDTITFSVPPPSGAEIWVVYKREVHQTDMSVEPAVPYVIGEWDFDMPNGENVQFRAVVAYGIVNKHDADDADMGSGHKNILDREVRYLLDEVFNPWDLNDAVHKATERQVYFVKADSSGKVTLPKTPVLYVKDWDQYCVFSERVIDLTENELEARDGYAWRGQDTYTVSYNPDTGVMIITGLDAGHDYKILYSTSTSWQYSKSIVLSYSKTFNIAEDCGLRFVGSDSKSWTDPLGVKWEAELNDLVFNIELFNTASDWVATFNDTYHGWELDFKVFKGSTYTCSWDYGPELNVVYSNNNVSVTLDLLDIHWYITAPSDSDVHVWSLAFDAKLTIELKYNATSKDLKVTGTVTLVPPPYYPPSTAQGKLYSESIPGRYEWVVVGRDAATVDSAGAALVSAAFKNKQVEIGLAGADMMSSDYRLQMPWVMHKFGTGYERKYFLDNIGRAALRDDWCRTWPIASSNIIAVGGPIANLLTYYANDFTDAFYAIEDYAADVWDNKIVALSCWSKNTYAPTASTGYAVIATYKDLNGTVLLVIWGYDGRDTYYATKWFHEEGIYQLQEAPDCVTSIILKISYESTAEGYKPKSYSIVEVLGTISERLWKHDGVSKGGIHLDP